MPQLRAHLAGDVVIHLEFVRQAGDRRASSRPVPASPGPLARVAGVEEARGERHLFPVVFAALVAPGGRDDLRSVLRHRAALAAMGRAASRSADQSMRGVVTHLATPVPLPARGLVSPL